MRSMVFASFEIAVLLAVLCGSVEASTTALYLFDGQQSVQQTTFRGTATALQWADSSGKDNDLYRRLVAFKGQAWLVNDLPSVASTGMSLREFSGGPIMTNTGNNFSVGAITRQRTVEFWYEPIELPGGGQSELRYIMSQDDYNLRGGGGNGWSIYQTYDATTSSFGFGVFQANDGYTQFLQVESPETMKVNEWHHLATTLNTSTHVLKLYIDGVEVTSKTNITMTIKPKNNAPLLIGSDSNVLSGFGGGIDGVGGFIGSFGIDDLRFSDVALSPGNGTGINELAWNVSLSPLLGDLNQDHHVNAADIREMTSALSDVNGYKAAHNNMSDSDFLRLGDVNGDGIVSNADLQSLLNVLKTGGGSQSVPEPTTFALALLSAIAIFVIKGRTLITKNMTAISRPLVHSFLLAIAILSLISQQSWGSTTALYLFDSMTTTSQYYNYADSSGVDNLTLRFPTSSAGRTGTIGFGPHPDAVGSGTSLEINYATPFLSLVPSNGNFSVGKTGQISIEFWYKAAIATTKHFILAQDDENESGGGNGWSIIQDRPDPYGKFALRATFTDSLYANTGGAGGNLDPGHIQALDTPIFMQVGQWYHVAVTLNAPAGQAKIYIDGQEECSVTGWDLDTMSFAPKTNAPLTIGSQGSALHGFANHFFLDELRFSDTVLLPGNGTGVGELAWNASLAHGGGSLSVPEPNTFALMTSAMMVGLLCGRRHLKQVSSKRSPKNVLAKNCAV